MLCRYAVVELHSWTYNMLEFGSCEHVRRDYRELPLYLLFYLFSFLNLNAPQLQWPYEKLKCPLVADTVSYLGIV